MQSMNSWRHDPFPWLLLLWWAFVAGFLATSFPSLAQAEPWLSTRFAQNCAGCHAPGRKNVKVSARRCSLNCQGCHINPSGGGLRSQYGKWNEDRWLRSFRSDVLAGTKSTAPYKAQKYAKGDWKTVPEAVQKRGQPLVESENTDVNESEYDRRDKLEHQVVESNKEFLYQLPEEDPYRLLGESKIDGGGDIRWQVQQSNGSTSAPDGTSSDNKRFTSFLMNADVGLRLRPVYRRLHLVYEGRYLGNPSPDSKKRPSDVEAISVRRSLYAMIDELPYSLYVMAGYYRPAFGYYSPDHTSLEQRMFAQAVQGNNQAYNINFEAVTIGGSPNLPYFNFHLITNQFGAADPDVRTKGAVLNLGIRFVTLGASLTYSYWRTTSSLQVSSEEVQSQLEMHSIGLGAQINRATLNASFVSYAKDVPKRDFRQGGVTSLDSLIRTWRENYLTFQFANANRAESLTPGSGTQFRYGFRSFLTAGIEILAFIERDTQHQSDLDDTSKETTTVANNTNLQLHAYF